MTYTLILTHRNHKQTGTDKLLPVNPLANKSSVSSALEPTKTIITSIKVFGDFKRLDEFIKSTCLTKDDFKMEKLPELPSKLHENGVKKTGNELNQDL